MSVVVNCIVVNEVLGIVERHLPFSTVLMRIPPVIDFFYTIAHEIARNRVIDPIAEGHIEVGCQKVWQRVMEWSWQFVLL